MKRSIILLSIIFLLVFGFIVSCPNGPEPPTSVTVSFNSTVDRGNGFDDSYMLDNYKMWYKIYPTETWSTELRGTKREWTSVSDDRIEKGADGVSIKSFKIGDLTPTDWTLEVKFTDESGVMYFYGKKERFTVTSDNSSLNLEGFIEPVLDENKRGDFSVKVYVDDFSKIETGTLNFVYRYNNSNNEIWSGGTFDGEGDLEYTSSTKSGAISKIVDLVTGDVRGEISLNKDDKNFQINLYNLPTGFYLYQVTHSFSTTNSYVILSTDGTRIISTGDEFEDKSEKNEGFIPVLVNGDPNNKPSHDIDLKVETNGYELKDDSNELINRYKTKTINVDNNKDGSTVVTLDADVKKLIFIPKFRPKEGATYSWSYSDPTEVGKPAITGEALSFSLEFGPNDKIYDGTEVILETKSTDGTVLKSKITIVVGYAINIVPQIDDISVVKNVYMGINPLHIMDGDTNYKANFLGTDKIRVYLYDEDEIKNIEKKELEDGRKVVYIGLSKGWNKEISEDNVSLKTGTGGNGPRITVGRTGRYFDFDMENTRSSLKLTLNLNPNTITFTLRKGVLNDGLDTGIVFKDDVYAESKKVILEWSGKTFIDEASKIFNIPEGYGFKCWKSNINNTYNDADDFTSVLKTAYDNPSYVLTAQWEPNDYTVTFDVNGGNALSEKDRSRICVYDLNYGDLPIATRVGYTFTGWFTTKDKEESIQITAESTVKIADNHTLFAHWDANKYTVKFNANGGSGVMADQSMIYDVEVPLNKNVFVKNGYTFATWNTKSDGKGKTYSDTAKNITNKNEETVILYAQWRAITYTVTFDYNNGSNNKVEKLQTFDSKYNLPENPARTGWTFIGWFTDKVGGNEIKSTDTVLKSSNDILYAHWKANEYEVTFDFNDGGNSKRKIIQTYDSKYELPENPTRTGWSFIGWFTDRVNGEEIKASTKVETPSEQTLYAHWLANTFSVTLDLNTDIYQEGWTEKLISSRASYKNYNYKKDVIFGENYEIIRDVEGVREGFNFLGWFDSKEGGNSVTADSKVETAKNHTLYAHWTPREYTLTVDRSNEHVDGVTETKGNLWYGKEVDITVAPKTGYKFVEWTSSKPNIVLDKFKANTTVIMPASDVTVIATVAPKAYTITLRDENISFEVKTDYEKTEDLSLYATYFSNQGHTLTGWFYGNDSYIPGNSIKVSKIVGAEIESKIYLKPNWTANKYTVTFNVNGGNAISENEILEIYGEEYILPETEPTREGYTFNGWYTKKEGGVLVDNIVSSASNHTLYAQWNPISYTIVFDGNGSTSGTTAPITATYNTNATLTANGFEKTGYIFDGWAENADGTGTNYTNGQTVKNLTSVNGSVVSLYAQWNPISYTITFNKNDTKATGTTASVTATYDEVVTLTANGFNKTGYTFIGWSTSVKGEVVYFDENFVNNLTSVNNGSVTLYAQWKPITYTVLFYKNDIKATGNTSPVTVDYDETVELTNGFVKAGYVFGKWNTQPDGTGSKYTNGQLVKNLTSVNGSVVSLYALWEADFIEIDFVVNPIFNSSLLYSGEVKITEALKESINSVEKVSMPSFKIGEPYGSLPELEATGWNFLGWYADSDFTERITSLSTVTEGVRRLYAKWEPVSYVLTLKGSDKITVTSDKPEYLLYGEDAEITATPKEGYSFKEWTVNKGGLSLNNSSTVTISMPASDVSITASAEPIMYTIIYMSNYSGASAGSMTNTEAKYDENVYLRGNEFTRTGYTFKEWNTQANGKGSSYSEYASVKNLSSKGGYTYLYAQWEPRKDIVLAFNLNGTKYSDVNPSLTQISSIKVTYDTKYWDSLDENKDGKLDNKYKPSSDYYNFKGWLLNGALVDVNTVIKEDKDIRLYADWEPKVFEISFDLKGNRSTPAEGYNSQLLYSDIKPEKVENIRVTYGTKYEDLPILTSEGWEFLGWSINGSPITKDDIVAVKANSTAESQWRPATYKITLENNPMVDKVEKVQLQGTKGMLFASGNESTYTRFDDSGTYYYGEPVVLKATPRPGYKIDGWSGNVKTALFAGTEEETSRDTFNFNMPSSDVNVSIKASARSIKVNLDGNEASFKGTNSYLSESEACFNGEKTITVTFGEKYPNDIIVPVREGWDFSGWYLNRLCSESAKVEPNTTVSISTEHTLYAKWEPRNYSLTIIPATHTKSVSVVPLKDSYNYGERISISAIAESGYKFKEWDTTGVLGIQNKDKIVLSMPNSNVVLAATSEPIKYTIVYEANGGIGSMANEVVSYDEYHNLASNAFTYTGYEFMYWSTNSNTYADRASVFNLTDKDGATVRLYAQWKEEDYDLELNLNGGTGVELPKTYTVKTSSITLGTPTREGYVFKGWSGTGLTGEDNKSVKISKGSSGDRSYTANWTPVEYTISYYLKNGELDPTDSVNKYTIESETFSITKTEPTRDGYVFKGWTGSNGSTPEIDVIIEKGSTGSRGYIANWESIKYRIRYFDEFEEIFPSPECFSYTVEDTVVLPIAKKNGYVFRSWRDISTKYEVRTIVKGSTGDKTYQAVWSDDLVTYYIDYDYDDGNGSNTEIYTIRDEVKLNAPTREGYVFIGWTGSNGNTAQLEVTIPKGSIGNKSYTANWDLKTYTVTLDLGNTTKEIKVTHGKRFGNLLDDLSDTIRGYKFVGWFTESGVEINRNTIVNNDLGVLHPEFEIINYSIDYDYDGGVGDNPTTYNVKDGALLGTATKNGYKFNGWIDDETEKTVSSINDEIGDKSFTASWTPIAYNIEYELRGGSVASNKSTYTIEDTFTLNNPTKRGYKFIGWTDSTKKSDSNAKMNITVVEGSTGDKSYTANWEAIEYNVFFYANGGECSIVQDTYTIETGYTLPTEDVSKKGYNFKGWKNDETSNIDTSVTVGDIGDKSYTANWEVIQYKIKYNTNGGTIGTNPSNYTIESKDIAINNPVKEGYVFKGWKDNDGNVQKEVVIKSGSTGDIELEATYDIIHYSIDYNYKGGKLKEGKSSKTTYTIDDETFTLINPERLGYDFRGWTGTGLDEATETVTIAKGSTGNRAYTANWETITHFIRYENINYENVTLGEMPSSYDVTSVLTIDNPTRKGYTFNGWTESNLKEPAKNIYIHGEDIWKAWKQSGEASSLDLVFRATWSAPISYTVTYNLRGGVETTNPTKYTVESDDIILNEPTRDGYTFIGWTGSNSTTPSKDASIAKGSTGNKTYYANWEVIEYTISYNLDNGAVSTNNPTKYNVESTTFTLINPTKTGYDFRGWSGTGLTGDENTTVIIAKGSIGDRTYTANWNTIGYRISYVLNGGTASNPTTYSVTTKTFTLTNPTRDNYVFVGWSGSDLAGNENKSVTIEKGSTGDKAYMANWTPVVYDISYDLDGGKVSIENLTKYNVESTTFTLINPTKTGYDFTGWSGTGLTGDENKTVIITKGSTGNRTYRANWAPIVYSITYDLDGGKVSTENQKTYNIETKTFTLNNPTRNGYTFTGWTGSNGTTAQKDVKIAKGSTGDRTYKANWTTSIIYTITYDLDGGKVSSKNPDTYTMETATFTLNNPTRNGYTFTGWTGSNGTTAQKDVKIAKGSTGNRSYTANWSVTEYDIKFNLDGGKIIGQNPPTKYTILSDDITITSKVDRDAYNFDGWIGTDLSEPTNKIVIKQGSTGDRSYTALWYEIAYIIHYNLDGGVFDEEVDYPRAYDINTPDFTLVNPTKTGFVFAGWSGTDLIEPTLKVTIKQGNTGERYYTANWKESYYTIVLDSNNGSGERKEINVPLNIEYQLEKNVFTRENYRFKCWNDQAKYTSIGTDYSDGASKKNWAKSGETLTLYAQWIPTFTIYFEKNASDAVGNMDPQVFDVNVETKLTKNNFTRSGYRFDSWNISSDGSEYKFKDNESIEITPGSLWAQTSAILYAQWVPVYFVEYNKNADDATGNMPKQTIDCGTNVTLTTNAFRRDNYVFAGWNTKSDGSGTTYTNGQEVNNLTTTAGKTVTLYAIWKATSYPIEYELNGGTVSTNNPASYTINTSDFTLNNPTRTGYTFTGWTGTGLSKATDTVKISKGSTGSKKYTANWSPTSCDISYNLDGGSLGKDVKNPTKYNIESSDITLNNPTRTGYTFTGWTGTGLSSATDTVKITKGSTGDRSYTANWTANTYTIVFNANGGVGSMSDLSMKYDTAKNLTAIAFYKQGYKFIGWATTKTGAKVFDDGQSVSNLTTKAGGKVDLYAVWIQFLPGTFSVSSSKKVQFSVGNLFYERTSYGNDWYFESNQYDFRSESFDTYNKGVAVVYGVKTTTPNGTLGTFYWGTSVARLTSYAYNISLSGSFPFIEGNTLSVSGTSGYALSRDEWGYLLFDRTNASSKKSKATINTGSVSVTGLVLLPDSWNTPSGCSFTANASSYSTNTYDLTKWKAMEDAGAVFLPAAGSRDRDYGDLTRDAFTLGSYWTSSRDTSQAYATALRMYFGSNDPTTALCYKDVAMSVRLVKTVN